MKNTIRILFLIIILQSCTNKEINADLIGHWDSRSSNYIKLEFYKDNLIIHQWGKEIKNDWSSDNTKIFFTQLTNLDPELETDFILEYKLNATKDSLFLKRSDSDLIMDFGKIKDQQN